MTEAKEEAGRSHERGQASGDRPADKALDMDLEGGGGPSPGDDAGGPGGGGNCDDELLVLICTANMGNAEPTEESVAAWLPEGGLCREVLEAEGHALDDAAGGEGTEAVRARVLRKKKKGAGAAGGDDDAGGGPDEAEGGGAASGGGRRLDSDERRFDVVVIGMQEATFTTDTLDSTRRGSAKRGDSAVREEDGVATRSAIVDAAAAAAEAPLTLEDKANRPDYDSEDEDEGDGGGGGGAAAWAKKGSPHARAASALGDAVGKITTGVKDATDKATEGAKAVGTVAAGVGMNAAQAVLTPIVMVAGTGGGTEDHHRSFEPYEHNDLAPNDLANKAAAALNPAEWALGSRELRDAIARRLGGSYRFCVRYQRGEMRLFVLVRRGVAGRVRVGDVYGENTGIGMVLANKGGMVVTLSVGGDTRLSFMTAHLEAHEGKEHYDARCQNLGEILAGARPGLNAMMGAAGNAGIDMSPRPSKGFFDATVTSHHSFVCGDLNFRVSLPRGVPSEEKCKDEHRKKVRAMVEREQWEELNKADELRRALRVGDCLSGFKTPPCRFNPTFKVERKEGYHYKENRTPSYTDRILYKSAKGLENHVRPLAYGPIPLFSTSDHKPMRGAFAVKLNSQGPERPLAEQSPRRHHHHYDVQKDTPPRILHLFITDIKCSGLPEMRPTLKRTDAYIVVMTDPVDILRFPRSTMKKLLKKVGWTRNKTKESEEGAVVKTRDGWPRTPVAKNSRDPAWGDYELHLTIRRPPESGAETKASAVDKKSENLGPKGAMLYLTVMNYDGAGDQLIGTVALSLSALTGEGKAGFQAENLRASLLKNQRDSQALPFDVIDINEPIVRYGKERGRLQCSIAPWDLETTGDLLSKRRDQKKKKGTKQECVLS